MALLKLLAIATTAGLVTSLRAPLPARRRAALKPLSAEEPAAASAPAAAEESSEEAHKSAVVFGFFAAKDRELDLIKRQYERFGYDEVVVVPSLVSRLARPSGWYKLFRENAKQGRDHPLGRHFDVAHCMSGGFLNLYLTRGAGVPLTCDTLLLDSTPILPKPAAFTTFARQFLRDMGLGPVILFFPRLVHVSVVRLGWSLTACRLRLAHRLRRALGYPISPYRDLVTSWLRMSSAAAMSGGGAVSYDRISEHAEQTIFARAPNARPPKRAVFLHNPRDPYLSHADVLETVHHARDLGVEACVKEVPTKHVQTIFQKPKLIFEEVLGDAVVA